MDVEEEKHHSSEGEGVENEAPPSVSCSDVVLDVDCHPSLPIVCAAIVTGELEIFRQNSTKSDDRSNPFKRIARITGLHRGEACRTVAFNHGGSVVFTGGSDGSLHAIDCNQGKTVWTCFGAHEEVPISRVSTCLSEEYTPTTLVSADENGTIKLWDCREKPEAAKFAFPSSHLDFVSDICYAADQKRLLTTGGDATLSVFDLRVMARVKIEARSLELETELLSLLMIKNGKRVVCGTNEGPLAIFKFGQWDEPVDYLKGHPHSVDCLVKVDEDTILTGSSDGIIRIVKIAPHKLLGVIGYHDDFPVERMKFAHDKRILATCSHDNIVRFWETGFLIDNLGDLQEMELEGVAASAQSASGGSSDDDADSSENDQGMDEDGGDSDDSDSAARSKAKKKGKAKKVKVALRSSGQEAKKKNTDTKAFFNDL
jgi:WD40 repeat protein